MHSVQMHPSGTRCEFGWLVSHFMYSTARKWPLARHEDALQAAPKGEPLSCKIGLHASGSGKGKSAKVKVTFCLNLSGQGSPEKWIQVSDRLKLTKRA